jgi:hypothetical protein
MRAERTRGCPLLGALGLASAETPSAAEDLTRNGGRATHAVYVQEYDIVDAGRVRGGCGMDRPDGPRCGR